MSCIKNSNNEFVFQRQRDGSLNFVGNFDALYRDQQNPWFQSGESNTDWQKYYELSRNKIFNAIEENDISILEVGCGAGYVVNFLNEALAKTNVSGLDISNEAIQIAKKNFPKLEFSIGDIADNNLLLEKKYEVVILNQLLWYILKPLGQVIRNVHCTLEVSGRLLISQAFFKEYQEYGRDILIGIDGLEAYMSAKHSELFELEDIQYDQSEGLVHDDGLLIYRSLKTK
tara:strand:+ start:1649 stop:2335 length:687 start_codon:yes stop_codon:yes gene_type:complete